MNDFSQKGVTEFSVQRDVASSSVVSKWVPWVGWASLPPFSSCCWSSLPHSKDRRENEHTRSNLTGEDITWHWGFIQDSCVKSLAFVLWEGLQVPHRPSPFLRKSLDFVFPGWNLCLYLQLSPFVPSEGSPALLAGSLNSVPLHGDLSGPWETPHIPAQPESGLVSKHPHLITRPPVCTLAEPPASRHFQVWVRDQSLHPLTVKAYRPCTLDNSLEVPLSWLK